MTTSPRPTLPPRLTGAAHGTLAVRLGRCQLSDCLPEVDVNAKVIWWGDPQPQQLKIIANDTHNGNSTFKTLEYDVVTSDAHFRQYLTDARKVFVELTTEDHEVSGLSVIEDLIFVAETGVLSGTLGVFDDQGDLQGNLFVQIIYESIGSNMKTEPEKGPMRQRKSCYGPPAGKKTTKKQQDGEAYTIKSTPSSPAKKQPAGRRSRSQDELTKVTFSDECGSRHQPKPCLSLAAASKKINASFSQDFEDDTDGLRRILVRSKERLAKGLASSSPRRPPQLPSSRAKSDVTRFTDDPERKKATSPPEETKQREDDHNESQERNRYQHTLPSWNLSTSRLKFIGAVTQLVVSVREVSFTSEALEHLLKPEAKKISRPSKKSDNISFFVSYSVPPSSATNSFCSRKLSNVNSVTFSQKSVHPTIFKTDLLDIWWTSSITFKVHSRRLGQRVPTLIGEASIGLKYLLTDPTNSNGKKVHRLSLFAGSRFLSQGLRSEIVGNLYVSFLLCQSQASLQKSHACRPVSPQKAVRDGEDENAERGKLTAKRDAGGTKITLRSRRQEERILNNGVVTDSTKGRENVEQPQADINPKTLLCVLRVSSGRNFTLKGTKPTSLFVSCRFLSADDVVRSDVSWNSTRPTFNMTHYLPVKLDQGFLDRCRDNFLVLEVWNFGDPNELVGVAMASLQQLYLAFKDPHRSVVLESFDFPVVSVDDWLPVINLIDSSEQGQLQVTLAAGTEAQVQRLLPVVGKGPKSTVSPSEQNADKKEDTSSSEHLYDTVGEDPEEQELTEYTIEKSPEGVRERLRQSQRGHFEPETNQPDKAVAREVSMVLPITPNMSGHEQRQQLPTHFLANVQIDEARKLPRVFDPVTKNKVLPSTFVTFASSAVVSKIEPTTVAPRWRMRVNRVPIPIEALIDPRRHFIVKLWHCADAKTRQEPDLDRDHVVGFAAVDLSPLAGASGFPNVCGWYNIMDFVGRCRGQIKVSVTPAEDLRSVGLKPGLQRRDSDALADEEATGGKFCVAAAYNRFPSHVIRNTEQMVTVTPPVHEKRGNIGAFCKSNVSTVSHLKPSPKNEEDKSQRSGSATWSLPSMSSLASCSSEAKHHTDETRGHWNPPLHDKKEEKGCTRSFLQNKLNDLEKTTKSLKERLGQEDPERAATPEPRQLDVRGCTLEALTQHIQSSLNFLGHRMLERQPEVPVGEVLSMNEEPNDTPCSLSNISDTSARLTEMATNMRSSGLDIRTSTLEDLGQIDWASAWGENNRVIDDDPVSHMGPERGNPAEDFGPAVARGMISFVDSSSSEKGQK